MARRFELARDDSGYPQALRDLDYPPARIYGIGDPAAVVMGLGVVGARRATPYGLSCARRFAGWAAAMGVTIISGAAIGCDLEAHRAAIDAGGTTVAVLGCGPDVDYPASASSTLEWMRHGSAVISEVPWGVPARRTAFVPRNRIIAALSAALLVVEAGVPSGTFSTADFALNMSRTVLAVPGSINAPEARGPNRLIRQGAPPVTDVFELGCELRAAGLHVAAGEQDEQAVTATRDRLLSAMKADPMRPDDLVVALDMDLSEVLRRLADLQAIGEVKRYPGGRYGT